MQPWMLPAFSHPRVVFDMLRLRDGVSVTRSGVEVKHVRSFEGLPRMFSAKCGCMLVHQDEVAE